MTQTERRRYMAAWRSRNKVHRATYERQRRLDAGITKHLRSGRPRGMRMILGVIVSTDLLRTVPQ